MDETEKNIFETFRGTVYPWQLDHMGHLNVRTYADIFDHSTWQIFGVIGITPSYMRKENRGMAGLTQKTNFLKEVFAGDLIVVKSSLIEVKQKTVRYIHRMYNLENKEEVANSEFLTIQLDRNTRKSCPFPEEIFSRAKKIIELI